MKVKVVFVCLLVLLGCQKEKIPADIPEPIKERVETFKNQKFLCSDATVVEFLFQNAKVYGFSDGNCIADGSAGVYDATGNSICTLGGLIGNTICNGESFSKATRLRIIWQNK